MARIVGAGAVASRFPSRCVECLEGHPIARDHASEARASGLHPVIVTTQLSTPGFGSAVSVTVDRDDADLSWVEQWVSVRHHTIDRFDGKSELSRLNEKAGAWVEVSPLLWSILQSALAAARSTRGLVTPTVLSALVNAGYDRTFEGGLDNPRRAGARPTPAPSVEVIEVDPNRRAIRVPAGVHLDLGGFAKGFLAEALADELGAPVVVDFGGDIAVRGPREDGTAWVIETDPTPIEPARLVVIERGGIATSGTDRRRWLRAGEVHHHIIDPRTGLPAKSDFLRVTIIAPTALLAEVAAKFALLLRRDEAVAFVEARSELAGLFVLLDGGIEASKRFKHFEVENDEAG